VFVVIFVGVISLKLKKTRKLVLCGVARPTRKTKFRRHVIEERRLMTLVVGCLKKASGAKSSGLITSVSVSHKTTMERIDVLPRQGIQFNQHAYLVEKKTFFLCK
jgi:hypothetical protein